MLILHVPHSFFFSFSLYASPPPSISLPPVWSELNQNRLLVNGSLVELWMVSECQQPPCCCLFSTGLMMCSLVYSGSLYVSVFPLFTISLPLFACLYVWYIFIFALYIYISLVARY